MTSYRVRVLESAGMALSRLLPSTNPWGPGDYVDVKTATSVISKMKPSRIAARGICYTRTDAKYVWWRLRGDGVKDQKDGKGVFIGETSRSLYERAKNTRVIGMI